MRASLNGFTRRFAPTGSLEEILIVRDTSLALEITDIKVERLQAISEPDCIDEGCRGGHNAIPGYNFSAMPKEHFWKVWESLYGKASWDANPWVWVIRFKKKSANNMAGRLVPEKSERV